jgi:molybdopterin-guanine dinucleotide biosynthesis protein A
MITDVTGVLLAGGKSRRMGEDKRFLSVGEETLYERSLAVLRSVFQTVLVVIAQDSPALQSDVPVFRDLVPNCGSLGGLYTGLTQAVTPYVFVVACDMPFLNPATVQYFTEIKRDADVVMAKLENGLQPMHALYHRRCLPVMEGLIKARELKIQQLAAHPSLRVHVITPADFGEIDPEGRSFYNVNTPSDLETARSIEGKAKDGSSS